MSRSAVLAGHERAGRVEPTRLAVRVAEDARVPEIETATPVSHETALAPGSHALGAVALQVALASDGPRAHVDVLVHNASQRDVFLESVIVGFRWTGHGARHLRFLRHGWQSWSFTGSRALDAAGAPAFPSGPWLRGLHHAVGAVPPDRAGWHESDLVTVAGASPDGPALLVGVLEEGRSFGVVYLRRERGGVRAEIELRVDAVLAAGARRPLERVCLALGEDATALLEEYAEALGRRGGARATGPRLSGWCSWYQYFGAVSERDVLRNVAILASKRDEIPVEVVQIDDGYQRAVGDWTDANPRFPRGMAAVAAEIRAAGFLPGLWTAPFCVVAESELYAKHPDWLLTSGDGLFRGLLHPDWSADAAVYVLDVTRMDVLAHLEGLFRDLVAMGFAYLKLDFLYAVAMRAQSSDPHTTPAERLRRGLQAIRAGAGDEAFLLGCGSPLGAAVGVVDGMRVGPDVAPRWDVDSAAAIPGIEATQPSAKNATTVSLARTWMHRRLWVNDPDCLLVREGDSQLASHERDALAAAVAISGGAVFVSDDLAAVSPEGRARLRAVVAAARAADTLGVPGRVRGLDPLAARGPRVAVAADAAGGLAAFVNAGDARVRRTLDLTALGLAPPAGAPNALIGAAVAVSDDGATTLDLAPHAGALLRVHRAAPLVVFCDFDGTFSVQDVGSTLARRHAGSRRPELWARFERGEITAWDYNLHVLDGLAVSRAEVDRFLAEVELDPGARDLVAWCAEREIPFRVLSDGFDHNLDRLQVLHGLRFAYDANRLRFDGGRWRIRPGHPNPSCSCGTGTCKRGRIEARRAADPDAAIVHIGNGRVSDLCGALAADVTFAKDSLADELTRRREPFEAFETLRDVIPRLEDMAGRIRASRPDR